MLDIPPLKELPYWLPPSELIDYWIRMAPTGVNNYLPESYNAPSLRTLILEAKVQVDRWDLVTCYVLFPAKHELSILTVLAKDIETYQLGHRVYGPRLWGADLKFSEHLPEDKGIALSYHYDNQDVINEMRNIAIFTILPNHLV